MQWCKHVQWAAAAALLVLTAAIFQSGVRPAGLELAAISERVQIRQNQLQSCRVRASTLPAIEAETLQLRQRLQRFDKQVPHHQDLPELIGDVTQIGRRSEMTKLAWRPEVMVQKADRFTEVPIDFTFTGDYLGVFRFLAQVENMQRLTRIRKLDVQAKDGIDGQVDVQLTMNIYFSEE